MCVGWWFFLLIQIHCLIIINNNTLRHTIVEAENRFQQSSDNPDVHRFIATASTTKHYLLIFHIPCSIDLWSQKSSFSSMNLNLFLGLFFLHLKSNFCVHFTVFYYYSFLSAVATTISFWSKNRFLIFPLACKQTSLHT